MSKEMKISIIVISSVLLILGLAIVFKNMLVTHTVLFDSMGGSSISRMNVSENTEVGAPPAPSYPGHSFCGWYREEECINAWDFTKDTVSADVTLFAKWADVYTISAAPSDAALGDVMGGGDYIKGTDVSLIAVPKPGCRFVRWVETGSLNPVYSLKSSRSLSATAEFKRIDTPSLTALSSGYNSITLSWTAAEGVNDYEVYRSTGGAEYSLIHIASPNSGLSFSDTGLSTDVTYSYTVRALCECGTADTYGDFSTVASAAPTVETPSVALEAGGYGSVKVSWTAVPDVSGYEIFRGSDWAGEFTQVYKFESPQAACFTDYGLASDCTYYYKLRAYRTADTSTFYSLYSDPAPQQAVFLASQLGAVSASKTSVRLTWSVLSGVSGYELYRCDTPDGEYKKIYTAASAPTAIYTDTGLINGKTYYYMIRGYYKEGSEYTYGPYSQICSAIPSAQLPGRSFTILYQGDPRWGFSKEIRKQACLLCAYTITLSNMGIEATPKTVYASNGHRTNINFENLAANFGVRPKCALDFCSPYLRSFNGIATYIKNPAKNGSAAVKEALNRNPDGVILYFRKGTEAHAIVACKYDGDTIYFSDPGRKRRTLLTFGNTWAKVKHRMSYANLSYIVVLERIPPTVP